MLLLIGISAVMGSLISMFLGISLSGEINLFGIMFGYVIGAGSPFIAFALPIEPVGNL